jgi:GT2 family glycosyltransferase
MTFLSNQSMKLSIVIVSWNVANLLDNCLNSINKNIRDIEYEVIVVDNNSHDATCTMVSNKYPSVKLIANSENVGFPKANNQALELATGEYLFFLNPDTEIIGNVCSNLIQQLELNADYGLVGPILESAQGKIQQVCGRPDPTPLSYFVSSLHLNKGIFKKLGLPSLNYSDMDYKKDQSVDALNGAAMLCRRDLCMQIGGLDDTIFMYLEDIDFCYKVRKLGKLVVLCSNSRVMHHEGQSSKQVPVKTRLLMMDALYIFISRYQNIFANIFFKFGVLISSILRLQIAIILSVVKLLPAFKNKIHVQLNMKSEIACLLWVFGWRMN